MVGRKALVSSSRVWVWVVEEQSGAIRFIFQFQAVLGRMLLSNAIRTGGEVWFQKHFGKILEDGKICASHFKCESVEGIWPWVDYLSAQANGADGGKRKRVKTGYIIFFSLLIWGWESENTWMVAAGSCGIREAWELPGCRELRQLSSSSDSHSTSPTGFFGAAFSLLCDETLLS